MLECLFSKYKVIIYFENKKNEKQNYEDDAETINWFCYKDRKRKIRMKFYVRCVSNYVKY
jgi:hypothetical protein